MKIEEHRKKLDGLGGFIDRAEATRYAKANGIKMIGSVLTSEDLW